MEQGVQIKKDKKDSERTKKNVGELINIVPFLKILLNIHHFVYPQL